VRICNAWPLQECWSIREIVIFSIAIGNIIHVLKCAYTTVHRDVDALNFFKRRKQRTKHQACSHPIPLLHT
jgi:hypothetical protein